MKTFSFAFTFFIILTVFSTAMAQQTTKIVVRAKAQDANFIGTSMGGALITITNAETGELLAKGFTEGSTGDTDKLVRNPRKRYEQISTEGSAKFAAELQLEKPTFVTVTATGPYGRQQARVTSSTQLWIIPGRDITGDGIILEIPGFVVDILQPTEGAVSENSMINIKAEIVMMCGCPTRPGGTWDSSEYTIKALIYHNGEKIESVPMKFSGETSIYEGEFAAAKTGTYKITVFAHHPKTDNMGLDKVKFTVNAE